MKPEEVRYRLLSILQANPSVSQRRLAEQMGVSVGRAHYALKALIRRGFVKADNFRRSDNKRAYLYKLTPAGLAEKSRTTRDFLSRKLAEYEAIQREIEALRAELDDGRSRAEEAREHSS